MLREPPDILITTPESLYLMLTGRAQRAVRAAPSWCIVDEIHAVAVDQARRAPRAHARAADRRRPARDVQRIGLSATQNPLEEVGRFMVGPQRTLPRRRHRRAQGARPRDPRAGRVDGRAGRRGPAPGRWIRSAGGSEATRRSIWPAIYPELLELVQAHSSTIVFVNNRRAAERLALRLNDLAEQRDRARPPRLARARGADGGRGAAQGRRAAVPGRDLVPRARDRHGRRRPRDPGRVAEVGRARAAADRPRRPRGRRRQPRADLPEVPRRPARVRGRRAADARGRDRDDRRAAQPARRARAADRRDRRRLRGRAGRRRRAVRARHPHPLVRRAEPRASSRTCSTCSTAATRRPSSPSCGRGSSGTASPARSAPARARASSRSPTPARSPTAASSRSRCPTAGASASSTRRWSTRRGRARRSCSARRPGGSRRSAATA